MCQKRSQIKARRIQYSSWSLIIADILMFLYTGAEWLISNVQCQIIGLSVYSELIRSNHNKHCQDEHLLHLLGYFSPIKYMIGWFLNERLQRSRHLSENIKPFQLEAPGAAAQSSQRGLTKHSALHAASCALSSLGRTWKKKASHAHGPEVILWGKKKTIILFSIAGFLHLIWAYHCMTRQRKLWLEIACFPTSQQLSDWENYGADSSIIKK